MTEKCCGVCVKNWREIESERISPGLVLLQGDVTILAKIVGEVTPILTGVDRITFHNTEVNVAELIECFLFGHDPWSEC